ncbi:hypothetical protein K7X08_027073 [Anisodus acutangulus]|uniref:Uncharacterized protein n=1 Tax=Anisodus acutangulus TaxID=402998 RepID=A0A9Q1MLQ5_9SOLA|nr:hypothetical protein K7X08_027073 [Anisodus acutangulus]
MPQQLASLTSLAFLNLSHNHLQGCIPHGHQFATFENPFKKGCGKDRIAETNYTTSVVDDQESNSEFLKDFWKAALMGYGSGLCIGLSIVYFMISTGNLKWLERIIEELEYKIIILYEGERSSGIKGITEEEIIPCRQVANRARFDFKTSGAWRSIWWNVISDAGAYDAGFNF